MSQVALYEVKNALFKDPEDWWEEALLRHPQFKARIARARQSAREGKGITIEQLRAELNLEPPASTPEDE